MHGSSAYRDRLLAVEEGRLTIRRYYFPLPFPKRIPLGDVREAAERPIGRLSGQLRIWGSGDLRCWWNLDPTRVRKTRMFAIETGARICPAVTPDDPRGFAAALTAAGVPVRGES